MSKLYDISKKKSKYYEQKINFDKCLAEFDFDNNRLFKPRKYNKNIPFVALGGVPLSGEGDNSSSVFVDYTDSHTLVIGPTGSKKSRLITIPSVRILGVAKESMIICDPKSEIYDRTAKFLKDNGYSIKVLNLRSPDNGDCWNPLSLSYDFYKNSDVDRAYELVNDIVTNIAYRERAVNDPFWDNSFASLLLGLIILLFKICVDNNLQDSSVNIANIIELRKIMFDKNNSIREQLWKFANSDDFIENALIGTYTAPDGTQNSILSVFDEKMRIFSNQPNLLNMLSHDTMNFDGLLEMPTAIFLILPDEKTSYHGLVSLFVKQSYEYIIYILHMTGNYTNKRVNYILDEFSSLPTINDFPAMITAARSRNIRFNIIIQSKHQLILRYKDDSDTIQSNCNNWIFLTSKELDLLNDLSQLGGNSYEGNSVKPILQISELQRLDKDKGEALIFSGRRKPYITRLPDISSYDKEKYSCIDLDKHHNNNIHYIKFEQIF